MIELKELFKAGVHFGHRTSRWAPQMAPYIWGTKNKIHLIDISKTSLLLNRAAQFLKEVGKKDEQQILFIGTKKAAQSLIKKTAESLDMPYVVNRWIGGTLSNNDQVKKAITRLLHLQDVIKKSVNYYTKKELSMLRKEIARLEKNIGGIINFNHPPAALVVVDAKREHAAVREALKLNIPVIAMVDTNTDPENINFVIPANDDSVRSIECILSSLANAFAEGKAEAEKLKPKKEEKPKAPKVEKKAETAQAPQTKDAVASTDAAERVVEDVTKKEATEAVKEPVKPEPKKAEPKVAPKAKVEAKTEVKKEAKKEEKPKAPKVEKKAETKPAAKPAAKKVEAKKEVKKETSKAKAPAKKTAAKPAAKKTTTAKKKK